MLSVLTCTRGRNSTCITEEVTVPNRTDMWLLDLKAPQGKNKNRRIPKGHQTIPLSCFAYQCHFCDVSLICKGILSRKKIEMFLDALTFFLKSDFLKSKSVLSTPSHFLTSMCWPQDSVREVLIFSVALAWLFPCWMSHAPFTGPSHCVSHYWYFCSLSLAPTPSASLKTFSFPNSSICLFNFHFQPPHASHNRLPLPSGTNPPMLTLPF